MYSTIQNMGRGGVNPHPQSLAVCENSPGRGEGWRGWGGRAGGVGGGGVADMSQLRDK